MRCEAGLMSRCNEPAVGVCPCGCGLHLCKFHLQSNIEPSTEEWLEKTKP